MTIVSKRILYWCGIGLELLISGCYQACSIIAALGTPIWQINDRMAKAHSVEDRKSFLSFDLSLLFMHSHVFHFN